MAEKNRVSGRTALVTGGAKGIGGEITRILADKGYTVVIAYNTSGEAAGRIITRLQSEGRNCGAFRADLSCPSQAEELYEWCRKCYGFVDTLINNAGICRFSGNDPLFCRGNVRSAPFSLFCQPVPKDGS